MMANLMDSTHSLEPPSLTSESAAVAAPRLRPHLLLCPHYSLAMSAYPHGGGDLWGYAFIAKNRWKGQSE
jgi:hypothetical protein